MKVVFVQKGISQPIESEGQKPRERKGLGYYGEELPRWQGASSSSTKKEKTLISTVFDGLSEADAPEPLFRRNPPTSMKFRYSDISK